VFLMLTVLFVALAVFSLVLSKPAEDGAAAGGH
jgi:hypothetical protein